MAKLLQNPSFLTTRNRNQPNSYSSSSFSLNFINAFPSLQNYSLFAPLNSSPKLITVTKSGNSCSALKTPIQPQLLGIKVKSISQGGLNYKKLTVRASEGEESTAAQGRTFLSFEEAGLVEMSGLSTHERFLCRLTISSLNLLRVIAEQERCEIEELNAGRVCDWFLKDKLKREQDVGSAILQWEDESEDLQF